MSNSPSSLSDNLAKGLHKDKCKNCKSDLEYMAVNDGTLVFNCVNCKKNDDEEFEEHLAKRLENTYRLCDGDTKNIAWRCLSNETSFQDKKEFYRNLTIDFRIQNSVESHDL